MKITTDMIVGTGLVAALLTAISLGDSTELQMTLGSGLIGYLGRTAIDHGGGGADGTGRVGHESIPTEKG